MKHVHTINNEIISYLCNIQDRASSESIDLIRNLVEGQKQEYNPLPGKHVINNILNYAKAMDVVKNTKGDKFILLQN